jgi:hypothetical protein
MPRFAGNDEMSVSEKPGTWRRRLSRAFGERKIAPVSGFSGSFLSLVNQTFHGLLHFPGGLVNASLVFKALIIRHDTNCFLDAALDLVSSSAHGMILLLLLVVERCEAHAPQFLRS